MDDEDNKTPEERREDLRRKELNHPSSSIHGSGLMDLVGSLGWKGTGILIVVVVIIIAIITLISN